MPPTTPAPQVRARYTNTKGQKFVSYNDGTSETTDKPADFLAKEGQRTGLKVNVPPVIPSTALKGDNTMSDVFARRNEMEGESTARTQLNSDYDNLTSRINAPLTDTPFRNPEQFIESILLRRPTQTENSLDGARSDQAQGFRDLASDVERTRTETSAEFNVPQLQTNLAETRTRIAERTKKLRETVRDFEVNAERRGVAREFVVDAKQGVQAEAAAELADLSIIEQAQLGNLEEARSEIKTAVDAKIEAFQFENAAIESEIKRLEGIDTREADSRKENLQIALTERTRKIAELAEQEKQKLTYLSEAAANGADTGTLDAIRKATNASEAAMLAGPFIGRLDRQVKQANIAQSYASAAASNRSNQPGANENGTLSGKPQNATQAAANGFADRIAQANTTLSSIGTKFTGKFAIGGWLPNALQTGERQAYEQAKRNFATAVLRRESGASIAPSEFSTLEKTYFPTAGDQPDVVLQKESLRNTVINSFYREANVARPVMAGDTIVGDDGTEYKVDVDGETLIPIE